MNSMEQVHAPISDEHLRIADDSVDSILAAHHLSRDEMTAEQAWALAEEEHQRYLAMPAGAERHRNAVISYEAAEGHPPILIAAAALSKVCPYAGRLRGGAMRGLVEDDGVDITTLNFPHASPRPVPTV